MRFHPYVHFSELLIVTLWYGTALFISSTTAQLLTISFFSGHVPLSPHQTLIHWTLKNCICMVMMKLIMTNQAPYVLSWTFSNMQFGNPSKDNACLTLSLYLEKYLLF